MDEILYDGFHKINLITRSIKGVNRKFEKIEIKNAVSAIVLDALGRIALVEQFRPCINKITKEIPAGLIDKPMKSNVQILMEELEEECGIGIDSIYLNPNPIVKYHTIIGSSDAMVSIYIGEIETIGALKCVTDNDVIDVRWYHFEDFENMVLSGEITDSKTIMAYYYLKSLKCPCIA